MASSDSPSNRREVLSPGAYAIVKTDPPRLFLAENAAVISRLIALMVVAHEEPARLAAGRAAVIRDALLEERWADAVVAWMSATDTFIDIYEEYVRVWTELDLDAELASMEIRMARIFEEVD
ncbi:MAG: hypothetical protein ACE5GB_02415 [Acidimicrobiales bacterium]